MQKITMPMEVSKNFLEVFEMFITSQTAKGVADITIRNYRYNMKNMGNYSTIKCTSVKDMVAICLSIVFNCAPLADRHII